MFKELMGKITEAVKDSEGVPVESPKGVPVTTKNGLGTWHIFGHRVRTIPSKGVTRNAAIRGFAGDDILIQHGPEDNPEYTFVDHHEVWAAPGTKEFTTRSREVPGRDYSKRNMAKWAQGSSEGE